MVVPSLLSINRKHPEVKKEIFYPYYFNGESIRKLSRVPRHVVLYFNPVMFHDSVLVLFTQTRR